MQKWNDSMEDDGFELVGKKKSNRRKKQAAMKALREQYAPPPTNYEPEQRKAPSCRGTVYVPSNKRGAIIGPGGSVLKALQEASGAQISMPDRDSDSPVTILGSSTDSVDILVRAIKQMVDQGYCNLLEDLKPDNERRRQTVVLVPVNKRTVFFGTKGCNIKRFREIYEVDIQCPPRESDSDQVVLSGNNAYLLAECKEAIYKLVADGFCEATHPGWIAMELPISVREIGYVVGIKGGNIRMIRSNFKNEIDIEIRQARDSATVVVKGKKANVEKALRQIRGSIDRANFIPKRGRGDEEPIDLAPFEQEDDLDAEQQSYVRSFK